MSARFVVLGLGVARSPWFRNLANWSNAASVPVEFVKCMTIEELRARLQTGRAWSAVLVDAAVPALDRDLVDETRSAGSALIVVDDVRVRRDWSALAPDAVINPLFDRQDLVETLARCASAVSRGDDVALLSRTAMPVGWRARVAMVCGPGGTGASTTAIALAQALADDVRHGGMVLLADMARRGEQAMLHDARDVVPGLQELVELHRGTTPLIEEVRALAFDVTARRYHLLLGLRRTNAWSALRPRAFRAAFDSLRRGWRVVVCDTDADLEGEEQTGSADVESRNLMARTCAATADVVFAVGLPGMKGIHSLVRVLDDLHAAGVPDERVIPVVNQAPRSARARAEIARAIADLAAENVARSSPLFLPERNVDDALRDGIRLPSPLPSLLEGAFHAVLDRSGVRLAHDDEPELVAPGSLGSWGNAGEASAD